ncbi:MAG: phosphoglycerate kinase [Parvibaculaceae bacterium]|nr:phosphoglycerate kinase [Parvibaculaceae bacterium]
MAEHKTLDDLFATGSVEGKRVLLRADLNVPTDGTTITDTTRLERLCPTLDALAAKGAKIIILSHFDRPKGKVVPSMSLAPVAHALSELIGKPVAFASDCIGEAPAIASSVLPAGGILVLENTRFHAGEEANDAEFAQALAANGDFFVNDAFSAAHRAHGSTEGITRFLPSFAGRAMEAELDALNKALGTPVKPVVAIVGGAKVSSKLDLLGNLVSKVDALVIGGGMANTFLAAQGHDVGKSLCEHDLADTARDILSKAKDAGCRIVLPTDVVVSAEFAANAPCKTVAVDAVPADMMILDAGEETVRTLSGHFESANTVVWNGPLGAFEITPFDTATNAAAQQVAMLTKIGELTSVAGGGDTVSALNNAGAADDFTYVSTAGGAFLEWLEGKPLPGVIALQTN